MIKYIILLILFLCIIGSYYLLNMTFYKSGITATLELAKITKEFYETKAIKSFEKKINEFKKRNKDLYKILISICYKNLPEHETFFKKDIERTIGQAYLPIYTFDKYEKNNCTKYLTDSLQEFVLDDQNKVFVFNTFIRFDIKDKIKQHIIKQHISEIYLVFSEEQINSSEIILLRYWPDIFQIMIKLHNYFFDSKYKSPISKPSRTKRKVYLHIKTDKNLNFYEGSPHELPVYILQIRDKESFDKKYKIFLKENKPFYRRFRKDTNIITKKEYSIKPYDILKKHFIVEIKHSAKYIVILANYFEPQFEIFYIPIVTINIELLLGARSIKSCEIVKCE